MTIRHVSTRTFKGGGYPGTPEYTFQQIKVYTDTAEEFLALCQWIEARTDVRQVFAWTAPLANGMPPYAKISVSAFLPQDHPVLYIEGQPNATLDAFLADMKAGQR